MKTREEWRKVRLRTLLRLEARGWQWWCHPNHRLFLRSPKGELYHFRASRQGCFVRREPPPLSD